MLFRSPLFKKKGSVYYYLRENAEIEVVMVVGDGHLSRGVDAYANRVIGQAWKKMPFSYLD